MHSEKRRVVITGMGAITSVGNSVQETWKALMAGQSGIVRIDALDGEPDYRCRIMGLVKDFDITHILSPKEQQRQDTYCLYAIAAAEEAMLQSGLKSGENIAPQRIGSMVSSGIGGMATTVLQSHRLFEKGPRMVSPLTMPMIISDMASGTLAMRHNLHGPNFAVASACATGLHSIGEASWVIRRGDADAMLAGGAENCNVPLGLAGFSAMHALSTDNDDPQGACRPFDATRNGFVAGCGSAVLVLEELEHAKARGATILAEVSGYGATADAYHITAPREDGSDAAAAIATALAHAELPADSIGYVNAHGTGTQMNDVVETRALKAAFGGHARKLSISSTKSMTGHMLGAAGALESIVCVKALCEGAAPGTRNLNHPDPECDLDYMPNAARELPGLKHALKINMGFGGHNAAVIYSRYEG